MTELKIPSIKVTKPSSSTLFFFSFLVEDGFSEDGWWADATLNAIRKTKSAEHIGIKPTIIVNR